MNNRGMKVMVSGSNYRNNSIQTKSATPKTNLVGGVKESKGIKFESIYNMIKNGTMSFDAAAHMVILELKRVYIASINDEHFGVEELTYLNGLIFNSLEEIIESIIRTSLTPKSVFQADTYREMIGGAISGSIQLLDYEEDFDYDSMNKSINEFIDAFNK